MKPKKPNQPPPPNSTLIIIIATADIERCNIDRVAKCLDMQRFTAAELTRLCGAVRLRFEHAGGPDDLFAVPAARRFIRRLHELWPWAGYYLRCAPITANSSRDQIIDAGVLIAWVLCLTDDIAFARQDVPDVVGMRYDHGQFVAAVADITDHAAQLCAIAGLPKSSIRRRQETIESTIASFFALGEQSPLP